MKPETLIQIKVLLDHWIKRMKGLNGQRVYLNINERVVSSTSSQYRIHNPSPFPDALFFISPHSERIHLASVYLINWAFSAAAPSPFSIPPALSRQPALKRHRRCNTFA